MFKKRWVVLLCFLISILFLTACEDGIDKNGGEDRYTITTRVLEESKGEIKLEPEQNSYKAGTEIKVTAKPEYSWEFKEWRGALKNYNRTQAEIVVDDDLVIGVEFRPKDAVIEYTGSGTGEVVIVKNKEGEKVYIPQAEAGSYFIGWKDVDEIEEIDLDEQTGYFLNAGEEYTAIFVNARGKVATDLNYYGGRVDLDPDRRKYRTGDAVRIEAIANDDYVFKGWQGNLDLLDEEQIQSPTLNLTIDDEVIALLPNFEIKEVGLDLDVKGAGNIEKSPHKSEYKLGEKVTLRAVAEQNEGYEFKEWSGDIGDNKPDAKEIEIEVEEDMEISAQFKLKTYQVEFRDHEKVLKTELVEHGSDADAPNDPTRRGYQFVGWNRDFTDVESNLFVKADFKILAGNLTIDIDGDGGIERIPYQDEYEVGEKVTLRAATDQNNGYKFKEWSGDIGDNKRDDKEIEIEVKEDMEITAQFELETYQVVFRDHRGIIETQLVEHGDSADAPGDPIRGGYKFLGWDEDLENITNNVTITAKFDRKKYTIRSELPTDAKGEIRIRSASGYEKNSFKHGETVELEAVPEQGYEFTRWLEGNYNIIENKNPVELIVDRDLYLQAVFTGKTYEVIINKLGKGKVDGAGIHAYGAKVTLEAEPAKRWKFLGWEGDKEVTDKAIIIESITEAINVRARFAPDIEMVLVEAGTTAANNGSVGVEQDFYMSKHHITQAEFEDLMGFDPSSFKGNPDNPVERVSWYDALMYCNKLSQAEGLEPYYKLDDIEYIEYRYSEKEESIKSAKVTRNQAANGYRLPTKDEHEYAARGGKNGYDTLYAGGNDLDRVAWYKENSDGTTQPVGKWGNELGLTDMSGNVYDWTDTLSGSNPIIRGGNWNSSARYCEVGDSLSNTDPSYGESGLGFRVVRNSYSGGQY